MKKQFLTALMAVCIGGCALGLTACHEHSWGSWKVSETPTQTQSGKATRDCTNDGCKAGAGEKEYILPALTSEDYVKSEDSATCSSTGKISYTYNKDGVSLNFDVATQINADAHKYGDYVKTDAGGHYRVCEHNGEHKTTVEVHDTNGTDGVCSVCGYKAAPVTHNHTYSEWVKTDPAGHYKTCTGENCTDAAGTKYYEKEHDTDGADGACSVCEYKATPSHTNHTWGAWTVTDENKPTKVMPGKATRSCTYKDCNEVDEEEIELPPLASTLEYTLTENTANCTEGGTATYTYKENTEISFTAATDAKGHSYGETAIVDGVPLATCATCGNKLPAPLNGTINPVMSENPSKEKTTFYAGGDLEYTLTANSGAPGYYTFTYEGEQEITVEYNYYSLKDGEVSGTVTLSGSGRTTLTVYLETRATCILKITSEQSAFIGKMSLEFSVNDPSYVTPELSIGLTTVNATYEGVIYEFTAPVNGTYTLSCESPKAVIILDGTVEELQLPYTFTLEQNKTISFAMCCDDETAEYDVQIALNMQGSGTFSDPYLITDEMIAVNISTIIKNGETKYYKIATDGEFLLNCLPVESGGSYPSFVSDNYTAEEYTAEKVIAEQKITVTGWKVSKISCDEGGFIFALTGSGADATDNVQLYLNHVYGSKKNPYSWTYIYFFVDYNAYSAYELGDTVYIDLIPTVTGRVTLNFAHLSNVKINGETVSADATPFEMFVVKDKKYSIEGTTSYMINGEECQRELYSITVSSSGTDIAVIRGSSGTDCYENDILIWWRYSEGTSEKPHKTVSMLRGDSGSFNLFANDSSYVRITDTSYVTFTYGDGITASFNGEEILSGVRYAFVSGNEIEFVNSGDESTLSYVLSDSTGDETNPFLLFERRNGTIEVEANSSYYIQTKGALEMSFTFTGITVTWNGTEIESGRTYTVALGDTIVITNSGETKVSAEYETLALFGTRYNPDTLEVGTAKQVSTERFFNITLSGDKEYQISATGFATPCITVNGVNNNTLKATSDEYALYGVVVQYNNRYYAFNADGVLCEVAKNSAGTSSVATAIHYGGSMNGNAYVVTNEGTPLVLSAGTHLIRVLKNPGSSTVLNDMSIGCTITVTEIIVPVETYTVTFVTNKDGVTVQAQEIEEGQTATEPTAPQCDGFTFTGWFTDADLTQPFDFATPITEDIYLYADWEPVTPPAPPAPSTDGTETNPYTVQEGVNSGSSTEYNSKTEAYIKYYTYTAETAGTITLTLTQGTNTTAAISNESYASALKLKNGQYIYPGDADTCSLTVEANQTVYIIAGADSSGETYSFEFAFVASVPQPEGTESDPYTVQEGVNSGSSTEYNSKTEAYIKYYTYTAETAGTITLTLTQGTNTTAAISNESYASALKLKNGQYIYPGDADTCSISVEADQTVYIIAGADSSGETYSFEFAFVASVPQPEGTESDPYTVQEGVNSGSSTEYNSKTEAYIKYYTYTAETAGTITLTLTQGTNTTAAISNESYASALKLKNGQYIYPGDADTCSLTVEADQTVYIIAGADSSGETYSFEFAFVAD